MPLLLETLQPVTGPFDPERVADACEGLGDYGRATRQLYDRGFVPPDVLMGMAITLLAGQPLRHPRTAEDDLASPIEGGVWVREQVTIHRPCRIDEPWTITGGTVRRFVRKGRRYAVNVARTEAPDGSVIVSNCMTSLISYRADESLADRAEGFAEADVPAPMADPRNPRVVEATQGVERSSTVEMTATLLQRRDGKRPLNPIHSDPERARKAGLAAPIAGGSFIAAFALELLMREWGPDALLHGAHLDKQWTSPTHAGDIIAPRVVVSPVTDDLVTVAVTVDPAKMRGTITIPRRLP